MKVLGIYGSGGAGRESKEIAEKMQLWEQIVFIDDAFSNDVFKGIKRINFEQFCEQFSPEETEVSISLGEPELKIKLYEKAMAAGYSFANIIDETATISPSATLGRGLIIKPHALISADATVGDNVSIEENAIVGHDSIVEDHAQISANVVIAGGCHIGRATYVGLSVPIKQGIVIGANSIIGMGSVVLRDIPDNVIAMGNPARPMKKKDESRVFK